MKFIQIVILVFISMLYFTSLSYSQAGFNIAYQYNNFNGWKENQFEGTVPNDVFQNGIIVGADYWFKPIEQRMEMTAGITYGHYDTNLELFHYFLDEIRLNVKNNFYMFSFNDCNTCPDFNKKGAKFKKGIFLQTIIGASYQIFDFSDTRVVGNFRTSNIAYHLGAGAGYDFKLSPRFILTPFFNYVLGFHNVYFSQNARRASLIAGIRLGLTKKKYSWE